MSQNVESLRGVSVHRIAASAEASGADLSDQKQSPRQDADRIARHRLIIEGDPSRGYVYKSVDRQTGQVVSEFPRETVLKLRSDPKYASGRVIDTKA